MNILIMAELESFTHLKKQQRPFEKKKQIPQAHVSPLDEAG